MKEMIGQSARAWITDSMLICLLALNRETSLLFIICHLQQGNSTVIVKLAERFAFFFCTTQHYKNNTYTQDRSLPYVEGVLCKMGTDCKASSRRSSNVINQSDTWSTQGHTQELWRALFGHRFSHYNANNQWSVEASPFVHTHIKRDIKTDRLSTESDTVSSLPWQPCVRWFLHV